MAIISTARLLIRAFTPNDAQDLYEYLSLPEIYRYEPGEPISQVEASRLAVERAAGADFWAIELKEGHKLIGHLYLGQVQPPELRTWELGYILNPAYQRKGYTTEAVLGLLQFVSENYDLHRVIAHCNPDNPASWKLLDKVGFRREGLLKKNIFFRRGPNGEELWTDTCEYALLAEEIANRFR